MTSLYHSILCWELHPILIALVHCSCYLVIVKIYSHSLFIGHLDFFQVFLIQAMTLPTLWPMSHCIQEFFFFFKKRPLFFLINFIFKLYIIVLVLPNIKMNPSQVYMCSPSWTLLRPPSPYHPSGSSQCTSPKHPVSCIEPGLASRKNFFLIE